MLKLAISQNDVTELFWLFFLLLLFYTHTQVRIYLFIYFALLLAFKRDGPVDFKQPQAQFKNNIVYKLEYLCFFHLWVKGQRDKMLHNSHKSQLVDITLSPAPTPSVSVNFLHVITTCLSRLSGLLIHADSISTIFEKRSDNSGNSMANFC